MKKIKKILSMVLIGIMVGGIPAAADLVSWSGNGVTNGQLNSVQCDSSNTPYLLWVLTFDGYTIDTPVLHLSGSGSGDYSMTIIGNNAQVQTPFSDLSSLTASATYNVDATGSGQINLVISHGCPGGTTQIPEFPTIALPIAAVIGLLFFFQHRKRKEE